jgi:hypothetical protein
MVKKHFLNIFSKKIEMLFLLRVEVQSQYTIYIMYSSQDVMNHSKFIDALWREINIQRSCRERQKKSADAEAELLRPTKNHDHALRYAITYRAHLETDNMKYATAKVNTDEASRLVDGFNTFETAAITARDAFAAALVDGKDVDNRFKEFETSVFAAVLAFDAVKDPAKDPAKQTKAAETFTASKAAVATEKVASETVASNEDAKRAKTE